MSETIVSNTQFPHGRENQPLRRLEADGLSEAVLTRCATPAQQDDGTIVKLLMSDVERHECRATDPLPERLRVSISDSRQAEELK